jgi:hypothetical protein
MSKQQQKKDIDYERLKQKKKKGRLKKKKKIDYERMKKPKGENEKNPTESCHCSKKREGW